MKNMFEHLKYLSQAMVVMNFNGDIEYLNLKAKKLLNIQTDKLNLLEILESLKLDAFKEAIKETFTHMSLENPTKYVKLKNNDNQEFVFYFVAIKEGIIVEILSQSDRAILQKDIFDFILKNSTDMIFFKGKDLAYQLANESFLNLLNLKEEELLGTTDEELVEQGILSPILYHQCMQGDMETLEVGSYTNIEFLSNESYYEVSKKKLYNGILCVAKDVTNEINASKQAELDSQTSLYNKKALIRVLKSIPKDKGYHAIEIYMENLGEIVKTQGIAYATKCLKQIANVLKQNQDALFFYIEGIGFIGLFDKTLSNPDKVRESFLTQISNINLPSDLKVDVVMITLNDECSLFSICD